MWYSSGDDGEEFLAAVEVAEVYICSQSTDAMPQVPQPKSVVVGGGGLEQVKYVLPVSVKLNYRITIPMVPISTGQIGHSFNSTMKSKATFKVVVEIMLRAYGYDF